LRPETPQKQEIPMTTIRNYVYAAVLVVSALNFAPSLVSAQDQGGRFTLSHEVSWQDVKVPAGEYTFTLDPMGPAEVLKLHKVSGTPASFILVVNDADSASLSGPASLLIEGNAGKAYVSSMKLPQFDLILHFTAPRSSTKVLAQMHVASIVSSAR
jgi:hypothetical protein